MQTGAFWKDLVSRVWIDNTRITDCFMAAAFDRVRLSNENSSSTLSDSPILNAGHVPHIFHVTSFHIIYDSEKAPLETTMPPTTDCEYSSSMQSVIFIYLFILLLMC